MDADMITISWVKSGGRLSFDKTGTLPSRDAEGGKRAKPCVTGDFEGRGNNTTLQYDFHTLKLFLGRAIPSRRPTLRPGVK